ncbi:FtsQ-type POTRA domain-containing protein [Candidatus Gottesmanbacteria bacterium]|nr:FtsQ-type POTRA domain-containing protein [Candidatus Gottesmanbacteria bacterium]
MTSRLTNYSMKRTLRFVGSVILLLGGTFFMAMVLVRAFTIRDIIVDAPGMTIELDKQKFGKNLLFLPTENLRKELLSAYPLLSDVTFERKFPGTLMVHLTKRSAYVFLQSNGNNYELDERGLVLGSVDSTAGKTNLFFNIGILPAGSTVADGRVIAALSFLRAMENPSLIVRIEPRDSHSIQAKLGNTNIFLPQTGDLRAKADTLQIIMEGFRMKGTLPTVIDLRFDKPVITN